MTKPLLFLIVLIFSIKLATSQDIVIYNQYLNNPFLYNPAWAGSTKSNELRASYRQQWIGISNAPSTQTFSFQGGFNKVGLGVYAYNDKNGRTSHSGLEIAYSYHVQFSDFESVRKQNILAFALSAGINQYKMDLNSLIAENDDPALAANNSAKLSPAVNFGILYQNGDYSTGFSATQLLPETVKLTNSVTQTVKPRTYYLYNSYNFGMFDEFILTPSLLLKYDENNTRQFDFDIKTTYKAILNTDIWLSLNYRRVMDAGAGANNAFIPSMGLIYKQYYFGYIYELGLSQLKSYNSGTHEITIGYNFNSSSIRNLKNPAYRPTLNNN